ncbi:MAG: hypothetical protein LBU04_00895 [Christensenellaceae bacterium]|jgi:hypothetical protein|nr:hypothetical protein [Christensenellaceae bacterium]
MINSIISSLTKDILLIVIIVSSTLIVLCTIIGLVLVKRKKIASDENPNKVKIIDGVRYTKDARTSTDSEGIVVSHIEGDLTLRRGSTYRVGKENTVIPGKYCILSASEGVDVFNVRVSGYVRQFSHNSDIVLADGDKICPVSHSIILR